MWESYSLGAVAIETMRTLAVVKGFLNLAYCDCCPGSITSWDSKSTI